MVYGEKVNQLLVVFDVFVGYFNCRLKGKNVSFLAGFALEYAFDGFFALAKLFEFSLVSALLAFGGGKHPDYLLPAEEGFIHALDVKQLALDPVVGVSVGVLHVLELGFGHLLEVALGWVGEIPTADVLVGVVLEVVVFVLKHGSDHLLIARVLSISDLDHTLELLLLDLHGGYDFLQERLELDDVVLVLLAGAGLLVLIDLELLAVLVENLFGSLLEQVVEDLVEVALVSGEDLELPRLGQVVVLGQFFHEALKEVAALFYEAVVFVAYEFLLRESGDEDTGPSLA